MFCWEGHREAFRLLALCDQNPEPTRQIRMLLFGEEREYRESRWTYGFSSQLHLGLVASLAGRFKPLYKNSLSGPGLKQFGWTQMTTVLLAEIQAPSAWSYMNLAQCFPRWGAAQDNLLGCWKKTFFCIVNKVKKLNSVSFVFISSWF